MQLVPYVACNFLKIFKLVNGSMINGMINTKVT